MVPVWYEGFRDAKAAGNVSIIETPGEYCHMAADGHDRPMVSNHLMRAYVGIKNVRYFIAKLGDEVLIERDVAYCDESCFCLLDQLGACYNKLDCTAQGGANCKPPGGGSGKPSDTDLPYRGPDRGGLFTPDVAPAPSDGFDTQTTVLREIIADSGGAWIRCAAEGAVCAFSGTRQVRYGARGIYTTRTITDGTPCDNTVFGDPVPSVEKACDYLNELSE